MLGAAPWVTTLGCELVIGDGNRVVLDGGDAALEDDAASSPSGPDSDSNSCVSAQDCVDTATTCAGACVQQADDCVDKVPMKGCPTNLPACKMMCFMQCVACSRCSTTSSACAIATR